MVVEGNEIVDKILRIGEIKFGSPQKRGEQKL